MENIMIIPPELAQPQYRDLVDFARLELNKMIIREFMELMS